MRCVDVFKPFSVGQLKISPAFSTFTLFHPGGGDNIMDKRVIDFGGL